MDALIAMFIIIGIVNALGSSRRKKEQQAREARKRAFQQAEQARQAQTPAQRAQARQAKRTAVEAHRAHTPEELQAHLAAMEAARELTPSRTGASGGATPLESAARPDAPRPAEPLVTLPNRGEAPARASRGEGNVSTQGESEAEHAEHLRRAAAEEEANRLARETLRDLREARQDKLRAAVVMSEVLGKPVSLRPRVGLHR